MQPIIGVVFDFDDTLGPDTTSAFLESLGVDPGPFWAETVGPLLAEGWDPIPAYLYRLIELSRSRPPAERITRERLRAFGRKVRLYDGVTRIFDRLRRHARAQNPEVRLEFYVISSGLRDILLNTRISREFTRIWSCDFLCDPVTGEILFPRNIISFTDKTRFLFQISKGMTGPEYDSLPFEVNRRIPREQLRIPFNQMIYVGDGYTDIPCFSLILKQQGTALGVYDPGHPEKWSRAWGFVKEERVSNLVRADYSKDSTLHDILMMATARLAGDIAQHGRATRAIPN